MPKSNPEVPASDALPADLTIGPKGKEIPTVLVLLKLSEHNTIPIVVGEHEVAVLRQVHPEEHVVVQETDEVITLNSDLAEDEYQRLVRKYDTRNGPNPVQAAYRDARELAEVLGLDYDVRGRKATPTKASVQIDHKKK